MSETSRDHRSSHLQMCLVNDYTSNSRCIQVARETRYRVGHLNVFIGANGSGKSNLLEAIGVLSAAADGKVTDQTLMQRGVRPGVPKLYKSAFPSSDRPQLSHISLSAASWEAHYDVSLNNPLNDPSPAWRFKTELFEGGSVKVVSRGPAMRDNPNTENGLAALRAVELKEDDPALAFLRRLQGYVIYSPTTPVLRVAPKRSRGYHWVSLGAACLRLCTSFSLAVRRISLP